MLEAPTSRLGNQGSLHNVAAFHVLSGGSPMVPAKRDWGAVIVRGHPLSDTPLGFLGGCGFFAK